MLTEYDVFISYSHLDVDWVKDWLLPRLESAGLSVCIDFRDFGIGIPSLTNMENAVERSHKTLLVLTPNWIKSEWSKFESLLIQTDDPSGVRQRTLPLMLEKCDLPKRLGIFTYADFTDKKDWDQQVSRVTATISGKPLSQPTGKPLLQPNLVHPYPLQANFTGRVREREELTAWLSDDEHPIYELVAMGGMGKSALTWYWLTRDVISSSSTTLDGVMWWSFYEGESSFARFIDEALKYVSDKPIDAHQFPTTYDRVQELRRLLQSRRILFVFDGFERQLGDYANPDAAYRSRDRAVLLRNARSCVDPIAARLLRDIACGTTRARVLITTRLPMSDLEDRAGDALAGVLERELREFSPDDAITFMRAQGVTKGTPSEIVNASKVYGYHPLSLRLLSGLIARDPITPGDIASALRHRVFDDLVQRQHHILEFAYENLPAQEKQLLREAALIPQALTFASLKALFGKEFGDESELRYALADLEARALFSRDKTGAYDMHIVLRRYLYDLSTDRESAHLHVQEYFSSLDKPEIVRPLRAFLCHAREDKPAVRDLYKDLRKDGIEPWLDEEDLLPGMDWEQEIPKAVRASDVVLVCLSRSAVNKVGYVQKEIKFALDVADEQPEGAIFLIPLRLEDCEVPDRVRRWQWVDLFKEKGYGQLMSSLRRSAETKGARL